MEALASFVVGFLMLVLPPGWTQQGETKCEQVSVLQGPPGEMTEECHAHWTNGAKELTVLVWKPTIPRDGGPMQSVEDIKGRFLGKDTVISRTSEFMGTQQEVLVTSAALTDPEAHVLIFAKGASPEEFQAILDGVQPAPAR